MSQNVLIVSLLIASLLQLKFNEISANECGTVEFIDPRIVRGTHTVRGAWPFLAALFHMERSKFFCGATLISAKNVLSAAHCVQQKYSAIKLAAEDVVVLLGGYNLDVKIERGAQQRDVEEIHVHPDWRPFNEKYDADLAIIVLSEIIEFTNYIRPICMPEDDAPLDATGSIVGWGLSENATTDRRESIPRHAFTKVLNGSYCYTTQQFLATFSSTRIFCGGGEGGTPNKGDSGGGLYVLSGQAWIQYGIISASLSDARGIVLPNSFSLYTNVRSFKNWIDETVDKSGTAVMTISQKDKVKLDFWCNYEIVLTTIYKCSSWGVNVTNENSAVASVTGTHRAGYSAQNVSEVWFWSGTLEYIPDGIGRKFTNLGKFWVGYDEERNLGLKKLKRSNFNNMELLWYLDVKYNNVESVHEDTFRDLPNLQYFTINNNKLQKLHKKVFQTNFKLSHVNANSNQLEYLPDDLFKNNALMEEAAFKDNKLKTIATAFTHLVVIRKIEFNGNTCIDKGLGDVKNVAEFQTLLRYQCNPVGERHLFS